MIEKRTQVTILKEILEIGEIKTNAEYSELISKVIEQKEKKNASRGETANQKANAEIMKVIKETLAEINGKARITDIQDANEKLSELSNQKMSALLKKLVDNGEVIKTIEKKIAYFEIAE